MTEINTSSFLPAQEASRLHDYRILQLYTLGPCSFVAMCMAGLDIWRGHLWVGTAALILAITLLAELITIYRRWSSLPAELLMMIAASLWIYGKFSAYGVEGVGWACALIAGLTLLSTARHGGLVASPIVIVSVFSIWHMLPTPTAIGSTIAVMLCTVFINVFTLSIGRDRKAMNRRRRRLDLLLRCSDIGSLEIDGNTLPYLSPRLCQMLGLTSEPTDAERDFWKYLHPDHLDHVHSFFIHQLHEITEPFASISLPWMEYPIIKADGSTMWVHTKAMRVSDKHGKFGRYVATFTNINRRVLAEISLRETHAQVAAQAEELQRKHEQLAEAVRAREEVERIARHDLKTPLNTIASIPQRMREIRRYSEEEESYLEAIESTAQRAVRMLKLQVDFYRMEDGRYEFSPEKVNLTKIAKKAAQTFRAHARSKGVSIVFADVDDEAIANGDAMLCETIIENILRNAIEASPDGASVTLSIIQTSRIGISVHNKGVVPPTMIRSFFHKYATSGKAGGQGLGSYSAWLMARAQGGDLKLQTSELHGTTVTLKLQRSLSAVDEAKLHADFEVSIPAPISPAPMQKRILVVDDDDYNAMWLADALRAYARVEIAINGRAAVDAVKLRRPDVIFMDLEMPVMNGFEALQRIRRFQKQSGQRASQIVAFTAHDDSVTRNRCLKEGFDSCVLKPLPRDQISVIVSKLLQ